MDDVEMLNLLKYIGIGVLALLGASLMVLNVVKITQGCPPGQILIKSVATYECIRR